MDQQTQDILALIRRHESDGAVRKQGVSSSYDVRLMGAVPPPKPLTSMSINEVLAYQQQMIRNGAESGAVGAYQIIPKTLRSLVTKMGLKGDETFDQAMQDRMGEELLLRRGYASFRDGSISRERFGNNLAQEWASLPVLTGPNAGLSYYAGVGSNRAGADPAEVLGVLSGTLQRPIERVETGGPTQPRATVPIPEPGNGNPDPMPGSQWLAALRAFLTATLSSLPQKWQRIWTWAVKFLATIPGPPR